MRTLSDVSASVRTSSDDHVLAFQRVGATARALGVLGGIGPWRELDEPGDLDMVDRGSLALLDRGDVKAPSIVFDSDQPDVHGSWYADGIQGADLVVYPGDYHLDVCDGHWPEVFASLLRIWRS